MSGVSAEVETIQEVIKAFGAKRSAKLLNISHLDGPAATVSSVGGRLPYFDVAHFACHAARDEENPLESRIVLFDDPLPLFSIIQNRGDSTPSLAFLSACETGLGSERRSEEVVHLAAGMLAAGYRGVVGTMWSIPDLYAPDIGKEFYRELLLGSSEGEVEERKEGQRDAAYALHCATETLRRKIGNSEIALLAWVPYVLYGV